MRIVRTIARPMLAGVFIAGGMDVLKNPEPRAKLAKPVVEKVAAAVPVAPADPLTAVSVNALVQVGAGGLLAAGIVPRLASLALAAPSWGASWWCHSTEDGMFGVQREFMKAGVVQAEGGSRWQKLFKTESSNK